MKKRTRPTPRFKNEQDERGFWHTHDTRIIPILPKPIVWRSSLILVSKRR